MTNKISIDEQIADQLNMVAIAESRTGPEQDIIANEIAIEKAKLATLRRMKQIEDAKAELPNAVITKLVEAIGRYGVQCSETKELAPSKELTDTIDTLHDLLADTQIKVAGLENQVSIFADALGDTLKRAEKAEAINRRLVPALLKAADMISSEYCSHEGKCGADVKHCYADFIYEALKPQQQEKQNG